MTIKNTPLLRYASAMCGLLLLLANSSNPPNGKTAAPFDGTCAQSGCHSGNTNSYGGMVSISGLPNPIPPNATFNVTITVDVSAGSPTRAGFQLVAVQGNNTNAGDLTAINAESGTEFLSGREYIEQRGAKNFGGGSSVSWEFTWKSPATSNGNIVNFYFTGNLANGGGSNGDFIVTGSQTYDMESPPPAVTATATGTNVSCAGGNDGTATVVAGGGTAPYTYNWSNGQQNATAVNLTAGNYTVTVTGTAGGTATASVTITQPPVLSVTASGGGSITCNNPQATATATASGGTPSYTYAWPDGTSSATAVFTAPGSYTVTVTDDNLCTKTATVTINGNITAPNANAGPNKSLTCSTTQVALDGSGSSQGANFSYSWSGPSIVSGSSTLTPIVNQIGTYTLIVTNNTNGCTQESTTTVTNTSALPTANAGADQSINCNNPTATLNGSGSSQGAGFSYSWNGPGIVSGNSTLMPVVNQAGVYTLIVTNNNNGCTQTSSVDVLSNFTQPSATATGAALSCINTSAQITATSNVNATCVWSGPNGFTSTQSSTTVNTAGTYTVTIINPANGCSNTATAIVSANTTPPSVTASAAGSISCLSSTVQIAANSTAPNATYQWTGPSFTSAQPVATVSNAGTYTVVVTDPSNGCTNTATANVTGNTTPPNASAMGGTLTCASTNITLNGTSSTPGVTYAWAGPNGYTSLSQNPVVNTAGTYTLAVANFANGCTATATAIVTQNTVQPTAAAAVSGNLNCTNTALQINGSGSSTGANINYVWSTTSGNIVSGGNTASPTVNAAGMYNLVVTNTENGCSANTNVMVGQTPPVMASAGAIASVACNGGATGAATANGSGGTGSYTYAWSNGTNMITANNLSAGTYTVTVTDSDNCTATATVIITQPTVLMVNATATSETANGANNGTATANPSGGTAPYTGNWSNGSMGLSLTGLVPGSYTVTLTDANGCSTVQTVTVNSFNCALAVSTAATNVSCAGAANGTAAVTLTGANLPATYQWSNGGSNASISGLAPGTYTVQINDANGCPAAASVNITEPTLLQANATATNETANGAANGTAMAQPTGGTLPYTYQWNTAATTASISNLSPGTYIVTVTDGNACTSVQTVVVNGFNCAIAATISATNVTCAGLSNGQAAVALTAGTAPFQYLWSDGSTTNPITGLAAGSYGVTITDALNCVTNQTIQVTGPAPLTVSVANVSNVACPGEQTGTATVEVAGGTGNPSYLWFNGNASSSVGNLGVGTYGVTVTDGNNCSTNTTVEIIAVDNVAPSITCPGDVAVCTGVALTFNNIVGTDNCVLPANAIQQTAGLPNGTAFNATTTNEYQVTDAAGNTATCSFTVTVSIPPAVTAQIVNDLGGSGAGAINLVTTPQGAYTYNWSGPNGFASNLQTITGLFAGDYTATVSDAVGCSTIATFTVDNVIGTNDLGQNIAVRLFPNPAQTALRVEISGAKIDAARIMTLRGQTTLEATALNDNPEIQVEQLPAGVYYLQLLLDNGQGRVLKFVKID